MTAAHEVQQVMQKLADVGRNYEMFQVEFAQPFAEENPQIVVIEHAELFAIADQEVVAIGVESRDLYGSGLAANLSPDPLAHFCGCVVGVCEGENFVGPGIAGLDELSDSADQDGGLAGASAGDDQQRSVQVLDGLTLAVVRLEA